MDFLKGAIQVGDISEAKSGEDGIEALIWKRQPLRIGEHAGDLGELVRRDLFLSERQHGFIEICGDDRARLPNPVRRQYRQVGGARPDIEDAIIILYPDKVERFLFPLMMKAEGKEAIVQVVIACNRRKHFLD